VKITTQIVGGWRYLILERDGEGVFVIVRRDVERDVLEDEIAFCYSQEVAGVILAALVDVERRKIDLRGEFNRHNFALEGVR